MVNSGQAVAGPATTSNRAMSLVLCQNAAAAQAIVNSLGLNRARLIDLKRRRTATLGPASQNNAPKLAIIVESDVSLVVPTVRALKRQWGKIKVLVHGLPNQEKPILEALGCGADGIVLAEEPLGALAQATRDVLADKVRPPPS
jgi:hypothetical protein